MNILQYYLQFLSEICEGSRPLPQGMTLSATDELQKAIELQQQIQQLGIPVFVKACADASGIQIPQEEYDSFDPSELFNTLSQLPTQAPATPEPQPAAPVKTETRDIFEVFLDSILLDDALFQYLIDVLSRKDEQSFQTLSHASARTLLRMDDFLAWLGNKELLGCVDEQACVRIMDGCLTRLVQEGERETAAALLSGDETTFKRFRVDAPELCHLPDATYEWFCRYYLDGYYPTRFLLKFHGIEFPAAT